MNEIITKINNKIALLIYRKNQLSCSKKNIKFYYSEKINEINYELLDLRAQIIYYNNYNNDQIIDLHGATLYFVKEYLDDLLYHKMNFYKKVKLITGKGSYTLFNGVKKYLESENLFYQIDSTNNFIITLF